MFPEQNYYGPVNVTDSVETSLLELDPELYLNEIKATTFLAENKFADAITLYKNFPANRLRLFNHDPFNYRISDWTDSPFRDPVHLGYNRLLFTQRIIDLRDSIAMKNEREAKYHFLLGNAFTISPSGEMPRKYLITDFKDISSTHSRVGGAGSIREEISTL